MDDKLLKSRELFEGLAADAAPEHAPSLENVLAIAKEERRRRRRSVAAAALAAAVIGGLMVINIERGRVSETSHVAQAPAPKPPPVFPNTAPAKTQPFAIHRVNDDELLDLLGDAQAALASSPGGKTRLMLVVHAPEAR